MGLAVVEQIQNLLHSLVEAGFGHHAFWTVTETDITLAAVVVVVFPKIAEQLTTAADAIVGGIGNHGVDALSKLRLSLLIDDGHELDMLFILAPLSITDIGRLLLWNEVEDMALTKILQYQVNLLGLQAALLGNE